jgi:hypothetical protein
MSDMDMIPMGRVEAIEVGSKKLTIQTEFFARPAWRVETKIYLGGALKKVFSEDLTSTAPEELQGTVDRFHQARCAEIMEGLRSRAAK